MLLGNLRTQHLVLCGLNVSMQLQMIQRSENIKDSEARIEQDILKLQNGLEALKDARAHFSAEVGKILITIIGNL